MGYYYVCIKRATLAKPSPKVFPLKNLTHTIGERTRGHSAVFPDCTTAEEITYGSDSPTMEAGNPFLEGNKEGERRFDVPLPFPGPPNGLFLQGPARTASPFATPGAGRSRGAFDVHGVPRPSRSHLLRPGRRGLGRVHGCPFTG